MLITYINISMLKITTKSIKTIIIPTTYLSKKI